MKQGGDDGRLFFRGFQGRSHEKVKLRKRKSTLYLSPRKSSERRGGEGRGEGAKLPGCGGKPRTASEGSICWAGLPRNRRALEPRFSFAGRLCGVLFCVG